MIFRMGTGPSERKACGKGQRHPGLAGGNGQGIRGARAKPQDPKNRKLQLSPSRFFLRKPLNMNQEKKWVKLAQKSGRDTHPGTL